VAPGGVGGLELDAGLEVGMVVDELAPDPGLPGDAGDARVPARLELGVGGGENERVLVLAVEPVGFQNSATGPGLVFYAARSYSLMRPPRTGRRSIRFRDRSATG
jgi:hypothetical protein